MVYAYDKSLPMPVADLYDTQIMAMAVNAAKDMYEKGQQQIKDFQKDYGDFISPIQKDTDWYSQNVTGKVRNTINALYEAGIDPLRSAEGRAAISKVINSIDTGAVGMLRQSAENAREFLKERAKLEATGLYNPLFAKYDAPDMNEYSTLGDAGQGVWGKMSPTPIQNMATFGNPYFEGLKPNIHSKSKNGISYTEESITADDLKRIADSKFNELVTTPQGQLMYQYYKDITGDDAAARDMFNNAVAAGQERRIYTRDDYDDNYFKHQQLALQVKKMQQDQANANRNYLLEIAKMQGKLPGQVDDYVQPMEQRQIDKNVTSRTDALNNYQTMFAAAIENNQRYIDEYEREKNASTLGYKESKTPGFFTNSTSGMPVYISSSTTHTPYIKNANSDGRLAKLKKNADTAKKNIGLFKAVLKGGTQALINYGFLDQNGFPKKKYTDLMVKTYLNKQDMKNLSEDQKMQRVDGLFGSLYSAGTLADGDFKEWRTRQFANGPAEELPGVNGKKLITTTTGKYRYAPAYKQRAFGVNPSKLKADLDAWLANDKEAWVWNKDQMQDFFAPSSSGEKYVTEGSIVVSQKDLQDFAKQYGYDINQLVKDEKLKTHVYENNRDNKMTPYSTPVIYYEIPVMDELHNAGGFNYYRVNETVNKNDFGSSQNTNDRGNAQRHSVMN